MENAERTGHTRTTEYVWYSDPGHTWLRVPMEDVRESGAEISAYSYQHDGYAYLEEDCDAGRFFIAADIQREQIHAFRTIYQENTLIRGYARYK